jgi:hypothetical protein
MEKEIKKVADIAHPSLNILKEYFENLNYDFNTTANSTIYNFTLYKNENSVNHKKAFIDNLYNTNYSHIIPKNIADATYEFTEYLKSIYDIEIIWFMLYTPKTHLAFHIDTYSERHLVNVFENDRFFSYESSNSADFDLYTQKMKENVNNVDVFNEFFLNYNPEHNKIRTLKSNEIYTFGLSTHNFFNDSDKLRACFVFEIQ